jgi:hypothetical protein
MAVFTLVAWSSLGIAFFCALVIAIDERRHPQKMWIMNIVAGDLLLAWLFGIAFQYFAITPMRNLSPKQGLIAAVKSDTLSIITFEIGLFAWMALTFFVFFPHPHLQPTEGDYWFMMQIGMIFGFFTSYPMNHWLISAGWKEAMG